MLQRPQNPLLQLSCSMCCCISRVLTCCLPERDQQRLLRCQGLAEAVIYVPTQCAGTRVLKLFLVAYLVKGVLQVCQHCPQQLCLLTSGQSSYPAAGFED